MIPLEIRRSPLTTELWKILPWNCSLPHLVLSIYIISCARMHFQLTWNCCDHHERVFYCKNYFLTKSSSSRRRFLFRSLSLMLCSIWNFDAAFPSCGLLSDWKSLVRSTLFQGYWSLKSWTDLSLLGNNFENWLRKKKVRKTYILRMRPWDHHYFFHYHHRPTKTAMKTTKP